MPECGGEPVRVLEGVPGEGADYGSSYDGTLDL